MPGRSLKALPHSYFQADRQLSYHVDDIDMTCWRSLPIFRAKPERPIHCGLISQRVVMHQGDYHKLENIVRKLALALSTGLLVAAAMPAANAQTMGSEAAAHPRIVRAIQNLEDAIAYLEAAPNNFGGHKAAAIQASRAAIAELRASLAFRAGQDRY